MARPLQFFGGKFIFNASNYIVCDLIVKSLNWCSFWIAGAAEIEPAPPMCAKEKLIEASGTSHFSTERAFKFEGPFWSEP
jgi:hypothetical protein